MFFFFCSGYSNKELLHAGERGLKLFVIAGLTGHNLGITAFSSNQNELRVDNGFPVSYAGVDDLIDTDLYRYIEAGNAVLVNASLQGNQWAEFYEGPLWQTSFRVIHPIWALTNIGLAAHQVYGIVVTERIPFSLRSPKQAVFVLQAVGNGLRFINYVGGGAFSASLLPYDAQRTLTTASQPFEIASSLLVSRVWGQMSDSLGEHSGAR